MVLRIGDECLCRIYFQLCKVGREYLIRERRRLVTEPEDQSTPEPAAVDEEVADEPEKQEA